MTRYQLILFLILNIYYIQADDAARAKIEEEYLKNPFLLRNITKKKFPNLPLLLFQIINKEQFSILPSASFEGMTPDQCKVLNNDCLPSIDKLIFNNLPIDTIAAIEGKCENLSNDIFQYIDEDKFKKLPANFFLYITKNQFYQLNNDIFRTISKEQLQNLPVAIFEDINQNKFKLLFSKKYVFQEADSYKPIQFMTIIQCKSLQNNIIEDINYEEALQLNIDQILALKYNFNDTLSKQILGRKHLSTHQLALLSKITFKDNYENDELSVEEKMNTINIFNTADNIIYFLLINFIICIPQFSNKLKIAALTNFIYIIASLINYRIKVKKVDTMKKIILEKINIINPIG